MGEDPSNERGGKTQNDRFHQQRDEVRLRLKTQKTAKGQTITTETTQDQPTRKNKRVRKGHLIILGNVAEGKRGDRPIALHRGECLALGQCPKDVIDDRL